MHIYADNMNITILKLSSKGVSKSVLSVLSVSKTNVIFCFLFSSLKDKPKIFFIQSCRGRSWDTQREFVDSFSSFGCSVESDGIALHPDSTLARSACPKGADFLLAFATTPGYVALRSPSSGSVFIRTLVEVLSELHEDVHLLDMLTVVNCRVAEEVYKLSDGKLTQIPAPATTLRAQVYL